MIGAFPDSPTIIITTTTLAPAPLPPVLSLLYHQSQVPQRPTSAALSSSELATPIRGGIGIMSCASTLRHTCTAPQHHPISDRETMWQLVGCIGLSVHKKVFAAGCTLHGCTPGPSMAKTLQFATELPEPLDFAKPWLTKAAHYSPSAGGRAWHNDDSSKLDGTAMLALDVSGKDKSNGASTSTSNAPPSPCPSPCLGSAMLMLSCRSAMLTGSLLMCVPSLDTCGVTTAQQQQRGKDHRCLGCRW